MFDPIVYASDIFAGKLDSVVCEGTALKARNGTAFLAAEPFWRFPIVR